MTAGLCDCRHAAGCGQEFAGDEDSSDRKTLLKKRAEWAKNINELRSAAEMYANAGETMKAIEIMGENGWIDM